MTSKYLTTIGRTLLQALAILLVLFALGVSLVRGLLPHVPEVRHEILTYVESRYGVALEIGEISAKWQAYGPSLTIKDLILPPQPHLPVTLISEQVHIKLDFWESFLTLSPQIETVSFDKVHLAINLDQLPKKNVVEEAAEETIADPNVPLASNKNLDWLYALLLEQLEHFSINDVSVQLFSSQHDFHPIYLENLVWLNQEGKHQGQGSVFIDQKVSAKESLSLQIALTGDGYKPETISGDIYVVADDLDLGEWASRRKNPLINQDKIEFEGVVNLEAWLKFENRSIQDGLLTFKPSWLQWRDKKNLPHTGASASSTVSNTSADNATKIVSAPVSDMQHFNIQSGVLTWQTSQAGWQINSHDFVIESNQQSWPELSLSLAYQNAQFFGQLSQINVQMLAPLLPLIPNLGREHVALWRNVDLQGDIGPIKVYKAQNQPWQATAKLTQLEWQPIAQVPGLSPIDIQLAWADSSLQVVLPEQQYQIDFAGGFNQPLQLTGKALTASFNVNDMQLLVPNIHFFNEEINLKAALNMHFLEQADMALAANVDIYDVAKASNYFPLMAMSPGLVDYLTAGLQAGSIHHANVLWRGAFNRYPYTDFDGVFQAEFTIEQGVFKFQPDWPAVKQLDLHALFENKLMDLTINSGNLGRVKVDGARVSIPELGANSLLRVTADLNTDAKAAAQVINASPLRQSVGETLAVVQVSKAISTQLDLAIPLYDGDKPVIKGTVNFDNNPVYIAKPGIQLNRVKGAISFNNNLVSGQKLQAKLFDQDFTFSFATKERKKQQVLDVDFDGHFDIGELPPSFTTPLSDYYQGNFDWSGHLMMMFGEQGYSFRAQADTDLRGVSFALPVPYTKSADEIKPLSVEVIGDNKQSSLSIKLAEQAEFWGEFGNHENVHHLQFYELMLGRKFKLGDTLVKQDGRITIDMNQAMFAEWLPIITRFTETKPDAQVAEDNPPASVFPSLVQINANINKFNLLAQSFSQFKLAAAPKDDVWRFDVNSDQFVGRVDFYKSWREQGLKIVADKLHLTPKIKSQTDAEFSPDTLLDNMPPLAIDVDDFKVFDMQFGHLEMQATPYAEGYRFQTISLTNPTSNITAQAKGVWQKTEDDSMTQFDVSLKADKFDEISSLLGINPGLKDAPLSLAGDLSWQGAPYSFSLKTLDGKIKFDFGKGHLSEISDKGARIFSLFSLDSILRKLSFDFSDVFGSGLYFDSFQGHLDIADGVVKTTDTEMDTVAGDMKVRGYADLTTQSLNYDVRFLPQLASSVPTVVFLSTSAWTLGIGAFALTKVLEPVIEVISEIRFRITGTLDNPQIQELERKSKEIEIPEAILRQKGIIPATDAQDSKPNDVPEPTKVDPQKPSATLQKTDNIKVSNLRQVKKDSHANQFVTVSKQSRRSGEFSVYRHAA